MEAEYARAWTWLVAPSRDNYWSIRNWIPVTELFLKRRLNRSRKGGEAFLSLCPVQ